MTPPNDNGLADCVERAVEAALAVEADDAEAVAQDSVGIELRVYEGEVESLTEAQERGVGVRAWIDGRLGYAYGTDLGEEGLAAIASEAAVAARVADRDEFQGAPAGEGAAEPIPGLHDPALADWTTPGKIDLARAVERAARVADRRVVGVEQTVYVDEMQTLAIASSAGARGEFEATSCYAYLQAIAAAGEERQTGLGFGLGRSPEGLDPEAIGREAGETAAAMLGAEKPPSQACPVVLDPKVAASFIGFIGSTLCADAVQRGRSPFTGRVGERIGSPQLTIADDGTEPAGFASSPFDGEGVPRGRTPLIEQGRLETYLYDSYTARRAGAGERSTGNAARSGYRSPPAVGPSNLIVAEGELSLADLLREMGEGIYVTQVFGLHSGVNPISGQFSVGASGRLVSGGELAAPVDEFTIASDLVSMLAAVAATGGEGRWVPFGGSIRTPPLLIEEMAVAGGSE